MSDTPKARPSRPSRSRPAAEPEDLAPPPPEDAAPTPAAARPARASARWTAGPIPLGPAARTGAIGFSAAIFLYTVLVVFAGIFYKDSAYQGNGADELHRIGLVSAQGIDLKFGVGVMVAALLVALAASLDGSDWMTLIAAILVALTCLFGFILSYLVYRYQLHFLTVQRPPRDPSTSFSLGLYAYMIGTAGISVVSFFVALPALLAGMRPRPTATATTADEVAVGA